MLLSFQASTITIIFMCIFLSNRWPSIAFRMRWVLAKKKIPLHKSFANALPKANDGIRILSENDASIMLWKTSNVAINQSEAPLVSRAASISVEKWSRLRQMHHDNKKSLCADPSSTHFPLLPRWRIISLIDHRCSGIVAIAKSNFLWDGTDEKVSRTLQMKYAIVLLGDVLNSKSADEFLDTIQKENPSILSINSSSYRSGTYPEQGMSLLVIKLQSDLSNALEHCTSVRLVDLFRRLGYPCLQSSATQSMISLISLKFMSTKPLATLQSQPSQEQFSFPLIAHEEPIPAKFIKFLHRETILHDRKKQLLDQNLKSQHHPVLIKDNISPDVSPPPQLQHEFRHHIYNVSTHGLIPRASSGALVDAALKYLSLAVNNNDNHSSSLRVLDLGCGSGAILISILNEYNSFLHTIISNTADNTPKPAHKHSNKNVNIVGVGVDIDPAALYCATTNAINILGRQPSIDDPNSSCTGNEQKSNLLVRWIKGDFTDLQFLTAPSEAAKDLHSSHSNSALYNHREKISFKVTNTANNHERDISMTYGNKEVIEKRHVKERGLFDVIVCNPPYLSPRSAQGRITTEDWQCLVGNGTDGLGTYSQISAAIAMASSHTVGGNSITGCESDHLSDITGDEGQRQSVSTAKKNGKLKQRIRSLRNGKDIISKEITAPLSTATQSESAKESMNLLKSDGVVLFQLPGGEKALSRVVDAIDREYFTPDTDKKDITNGTLLTKNSLSPHRKKFEVVEVIKDLRGINRCLVLRLIPSEGNKKEL